MSTYAMDMEPHQRPGGPVRSIYGHGRQIRQDAHAVVADLHEAANAVQQFIIDGMKHEPYTTLVVSAGVGYVLGGGLSSRVTRLLIGVGTKLVLAVAARRLGVWIDVPHGSRAPL